MNDAKTDAKEIFLGALDCASPEELARFLDEACAGDATLRARVEDLLRARRQAGSFLGGAWSSPTEQLSPLAEGPGTVIGPYKLLQQIGEGGMGVVFMAEQSHPVQRTVALKIIKPGMDTRQVIARFEAERQALALMDHPNIARVIDAGTTGGLRDEGLGFRVESSSPPTLNSQPSTLNLPTGRPYFVMDLVKGVPITEYCDQQHLPIRQRLELMTQVCHAVQHAHQKGIIHRDLKPSNVLVAEYDGKPVPKIIDFGVAKATAQRLTEKTMFTELGQLIGTFEYMSPEQARFNQLDVDTRSDVYSLGVLLYELLTGSTPLEKERLRSAAFDEILRLISEEDPPRPSTRLSSLSLGERAGVRVPSSLASIAANRHTEPAKLTKEISGELDWLVMKCLEKDRNRRYATASSLANDLQRYLADETVEARPSTRAYQFKKFIRRNKLGVIAAAAFLAALAAGLAISSVGFIQARRQTVIARSEADRADREAKNSQIQTARSEEVSQFLQDMLAAVGPSVALGRDTTLLREILDNTAKRVATDLKDQPVVQADLWSTLGQTYGSLGDEVRAVDTLQQAVECYRAALGKESSEMALAFARLGRWQTRSGNIADGNVNAKLGLEMAQRFGDKRVIVQCLEYYAYSFDSLSSTEESIPYLRKAVAIAQELEMDPLYQAHLMGELGIRLNETDNWEETESLLRQTLAINRQHYRSDHPAVIVSLYYLAQCLQNQAKIDEAEAAAREGFDLVRNVYPPETILPYLIAVELFEILVQREESDKAQEVCEQLVAFAPLNARSWSLLGRAHAMRGDLGAAVNHFSRAAQLTPNDHSISWDLSMALLSSGRTDEYRAHCRQVLERDAETREYQIADVAAKAALLLPVDGADYERACQLADFAGTCTKPKWLVPYVQLVKALAEYRRGRFDSAIDWAARAADTNTMAFQCRAAALCIQSCSYARQKNWDFASAALNKADRLAKLGRDKTRKRYNPLWRDWAAFEHLRSEAAELLHIGQSQIPTDADPPSTNH